MNVCMYTSTEAIIRAQHAKNGVGILKHRSASKEEETEKRKGKRRNNTKARKKKEAQPSEILPKSLPVLLYLLPT